MAIENTYLLGKNITLGCGFDLQAKAPLDSRQTVPSFAGLQALINYDAAYEGMIVYDEETKKTYQAQKCDPYTVEVDDKTKTYDIRFREFGINESELKDLIASETTAAMEFKGAAAALPENPAKGDFYKVTAEFAVGEETAKVGDSIVYDGAQWFLIPSGDDIEDTWRPVTDVANDATLTFAAGDKLDVAVASNGTVTYSHEAIDAPTATPVGEDEQTRTYITSVETDGHGHITGYKTATETVKDTNTKYTFEGQSDEATSVYFQVTSNEEGAAAEVIYLDAYSKNEANEKFVEKVTGKQLSTEDFTTALLNKLNGIDDEANKYEHAEHTAYAEGFYKVTVDTEGHVSNATAVTKEDIVALGIPGHDTTYEKAAADADGLMSKEHFAKVNGISEGATKVEASETNGNIKIDGVETTVYTHPEKHAISDVTGLQDAIDGKQDIIADNTYDEYGAAAAVLGTDQDGDDKATVYGAIALANNKVSGITTEDASIYVEDGVNGNRIIRVQISSGENNALELAEDGLSVDAVKNSTFDTFKTENSKAISDAQAAAIAAAKTETESQVKALAEGAVADNAADIADIIEMLTWGSFGE